jgi:hypothetical protein
LPNEYIHRYQYLGYQLLPGAHSCATSSAPGRKHSSGFDSVPAPDDG